MMIKGKFTPVDQGSNGDGTEKVTVESPDLATVKKWLKDDIGRAVSLLTALHNDQDLQSAMAEWMLGRIQNFKNKPVVDPAQQALFPGVRPEDHKPLKS